MSTGTHEYADDPRNADILIHVNGELVHRDEALELGERIGHDDGVAESRLVAADAAAIALEQVVGDAVHLARLATRNATIDKSWSSIKKNTTSMAI